MDDNSVIDLNAKRNELQERRRREFERILFDNFLGVYTLLEGLDDLIPIKMVNISESGCMFQVPIDSKFAKNLKKSTYLDLRFYFTKDSFITVGGDIKYSKEFKDVDDLYYLRFGYEFNRKPKSFEAMSSFIAFIMKFSEHALSDKNGRVVLHY